MSFFDKVRNAFSSGTEAKQGGTKDGLSIDVKTKGCFSCERPFSIGMPANPCSFCLRSYCSNCLCALPPQGAQTHWKASCEFCYHHRVDTPGAPQTPLSAVETAAHVQAIAETVSAVFNKAPFPASHEEFAGSPGTLSPSLSMRTSALYPSPSMGRTTSMRPGQIGGAHKQAQGDLTWEVPPELDPDFGLSLRDRDRRLIVQQQEAATVEPAEGAAGSSGVAASTGAVAAGAGAGPSAAAVVPGAAKVGEEGGADVAGSTRSEPPDSQGAAPTLSGAASNLLHPPAANLPHSLLDLNRVLLGNAASSHLTKLVTQLLESEHAAHVDTWAPIVVRLAEAAAQAVSPSVMITHGVMDPRHYIKVKQLPFIGTPDDSSMLPAVVCKRNVAHRRMRTHLQWPKVVLLAGSLEPGSVGVGSGRLGAAPEKLSRIEALIGTEQEVLRTALARLLAAAPDVVVVERSVARWLQEELLTHNITLVLGVKPELMERLARCMGTRVVNNIETLTTAHVGVCKEFKVETQMPQPQAAVPGTATPQGLGSSLPGLGRNSSFSGASAAVAQAQVQSAAAALASGATGGVSAPLPAQPRTIMSFSCATPIGATVLLRGAAPEQLARVKRVMRFAIYAAYALRLETSMLADHMTAALACMGSEIPCSPTGGLNAFHALCGAAIASSVANSRTAMPHGVIVSLSPHASFFDATLAAECAEGIKEAIQAEVKHAELLRQAHIAADVLQQLQTTHAAPGGSVGGDAGSAGTQADAEGEAAAKLSASMYSLAIGIQQPSTHASPAPPAPPQPASPHGPLHIEHEWDPLRTPNGSVGFEGGAGTSITGNQPMASLAAGAVPQPPSTSATPAVAGHLPAGIPLSQGAEAGGKAGEEVNEPGHCPQHLTMRRNQGTGVYDWQRIFISMACRNPKKQLQCEPAGIKRFSFYGTAPMDMSLLQFFLAAAPAPHKRCPAPGCGDGVTAHVRTFMHLGTRITMSCATIAASEALPNEDKQQLWLWLRPKGKGADARADVRRVPLSPEAAAISFGHFLQLTFTAERLEMAGRSLNHDFVRYLGMGRTVMCMFQDRIVPLEVSMPDCATSYSLAAQLKWLKQESAELAQEAEEAFDIIEQAMGMQPQLQPQASGSVTMGSSVDDGTGPLASVSGTSQAGGLLGEAVGALPGVPNYKALVAAVRRDRTDVLEAVAECVRRVTPSAAPQSAAPSVGGALVCVPEDDDRDDESRRVSRTLTAVHFVLPNGGMDENSDQGHQGPTVTTVTAEGMVTSVSQRMGAMVEDGGPVPSGSTTPGAHPGGAFATMAAQQAAGGAFGSFLEPAQAAAAAVRPALADLEPSLRGPGSIALHSRSASLAAHLPGINEGGVQGGSQSQLPDLTVPGGASTGGASLPTLPRPAGGLSSALNDMAGMGSINLSAALAVSKGSKGMQGLSGLSPRASNLADLAHMLPSGPEGGAGAGTGAVDAGGWEAVVTHGVHVLNATRRRLAGTLAFWAALLQDPQGVCHLAAHYGAVLNTSGQLHVSGVLGGVGTRMSTPMARSSFEAGGGLSGLEGGSAAPPSTVGSHGGSGMLIPTMSVGAGAVSSMGMPMGASGLEPAPSAPPPSLGGAVQGGSTGGGLFGITPAVQRITMASQLEAETASGGFIPVPIAPGPTGPINTHNLLESLLTHRGSPGHHAYHHAHPAPGSSPTAPGGLLLEGSRSVVGMVSGITARRGSYGAGGPDVKSPSRVSTRPGSIDLPSHVHFAASGPLGTSQQLSRQDSGEHGDPGLAVAGNTDAVTDGRKPPMRLGGTQSLLDRVALGLSGQTGVGPGTGTVTPVAGVSRPASVLGGDDDEDDDDEYEDDDDDADGEEEEDDEEDEDDEVYRYYGLGSTIGGTGRTSVLDDEDDDSAFYPQGLPPWNEEESDTQPSHSTTSLTGQSVDDSAASVSVRGPAHVRTPSNAMALGGLPVTMAPGAAGAQKGEAGRAGLDSHSSAPAAASDRLPPAPIRTGTQLMAQQQTQVHEAGGPGSMGVSPTASEAIGGSQFSVGSRSGGLPPIPRQPTMARRIGQNVRRKLESLVTGGGGTVLARFRMPGRALLTPGVSGAVVPIHDLEPSSIVAHALSSVLYAQLLNAATKAVVAEVRRAQLEAGGASFSGPTAAASSQGMLHMTPSMVAPPLSFSAQEILAQQALGAREAWVSSARSTMAGGVPGAGPSGTQPPSSTPSLHGGAVQASAGGAGAAGSGVIGPGSVGSSMSSVAAPSMTSQAALGGGSISPAHHSLSTSGVEQPTHHHHHQPPLHGASTGALLGGSGGGWAPRPSSLAPIPSVPLSGSGRPPPISIASSSQVTLPLPSPSHSNLSAQPTPTSASQPPANTGNGAILNQAADAADVPRGNSAASGTAAASGPVLPQPPPVYGAGGVGFGTSLNQLRPRIEPDMWGQVLWSREPAHIKVAWEDKPPGMQWAHARFEVVVYFAPQFAELRRRLVQGGEAAFVASMARCARWAQRGGKSNSYFAKTRDDRFIIKSMSKAEKASFLECTPAYLHHMAKTALAGRRTCLAKILGAFSVTCNPAGSGGLARAKGGAKGDREGLELIVMENCFYDRQVSRIYDLKGSERNRYNEAAAADPHDAKEVHLDDNLRRDVTRTPLLVTPDSLRLMELALYEDTAFLANLGVMDYSLLVGVDREDAVLAVAIIDYVRTYTWDKQLETWVKGSGLLGGNGKEPTIVSPKQYMRRFRAAIMSYFTVVPASADVQPLLSPDYEWPQKGHKGMGEDGAGRMD